MKTKGWSERRRKRQACNARRCKPWRASTGPKTPGGKQAVGRNNLRHGLYGGPGRALKRALKMQEEFLEMLAESKKSVF